MKNSDSMVSDSLDLGVNRNNLRDVLSFAGKKFGFLIFGLLFLTAAYNNINGQQADAFNPNVDNGVAVIRQQTDGKIIIGGGFASVGGQTRNRIARLNADGTLDSSFANGSLSNPVRSMVIQSDGKIVVGTVGTSTPNQALNQIFRFNADGTTDSTFTANIANGIYSMELQSDGKIFVAGFFTSVNGQSRNNLARLNSDGTLDTTFTPVVDGTLLTSFLQTDGKILIGGIFSNVGGVARNRLARLNTDGTLDTTFSLPATVSYGSGRGVQDIALQSDGKIIIGGYDSADGSIKFVSRLNADGTIDTAFNQNIEPLKTTIAVVRSVAVQANGKILVGGGFTSPQTSLYRINADGTTDLAFNPRPIGQINFSSVDDIVVQADQKILVGGSFIKIGGVDRNSFARILSNSRSIPATGFDFDGDTRADVSFFRPSNGNWYIYQSTSSSWNPSITVAFGTSTDRLAPADYDGDFVSDIAVFREGSSSFFYIIQSRTNTFRAEQFGTLGDVPTVGDWDGDNKADLAVYRNGATAGAQSYFYYRPTATSSNFIQLAWGATGDKPVVGDYDADGKIDLAVFRPSNGAWYVSRSSDNQLQAAQFGISTDKLVAADYDGDGKTDYAVFRDGTWYLQRSTAGFTGVSFGASGDILVPADYDGDGKTDIGVARNGTWYIQRSTAGAVGGNYSAVGDVPVQSAYVQ